MLLMQKVTKLPSVEFLGALCLFLAAIEMLIPKPFPFLKLGLANLPILLFIRHLSLKQLLQLAFIKVVSQGLIAANLLSYVGVFSLCSTLASVLGMRLIAYLSPRYVSFLGISIIGAMMSNFAQLVLALLWFFPEMGSLLLPWCLGFGALSGLFLGFFALQFSQRSQWYRPFRLQEEQSLC